MLLNLTKILLALFGLTIFLFYFAPKHSTKTLHDKASKLVSDIRYTQKTNRQDGKDSYKIQNSKYKIHLLFSQNKYELLSEYKAKTLKTVTYKDVNISFEGGCKNMGDLSFDSFGNPLINNAHYSKDYYTSVHHLSATCIIILKNTERKISIHVAPESGFINIMKEENIMQ